MAEGANKKYKKRVIQPDSEDEEQEQEPKRPRTGSPNATTPTEAPEPQRTREPIMPPAANAPSNAIAGPAPLPAPAKAKLDVFTTGGSDDEDEDMDKEVNGANGKRAQGEEDSNVNVEEGAAAKKKQKKEKEVKKPVSKEKKSSTAKKDEKKRAAANDDDSSEDEKPLASIVSNNKKKPTSAASTSQNAKASTSTKKRPSKASSSKKVTSDSELSEPPSDDDDVEDDADDDSDVPLASRKKKAVTKKAPAKPKAKAAPAAKEKKAKKEAPAVKRVKKAESQSPAPSSSPAKKGAASKGKGKPKSEKGESEAGGDDDGSDGDNVYKWWEDQDDDGVKWKTLQHSGVLFPPEYEAHGVQMKYDGKPVVLAPEAEEVASFFAAILESDYPKNPTFVKNFFTSFREVLKEHPCPDGTQINSFDKCDFTPIFAYLEAEKVKKKSITTAQKKALKEEKAKAEAAFATCLLDGRVEKVGNFRVEPPGLFRGRGEHPKTGLLKTRVQPEQITINIGEDATVPAPPPGHKWKSVVHDPNVTWLATWKENINGAVKYVFLGAGSSLKGQSDLKKFEKARALKVRPFHLKLNAQRPTPTHDAFRLRTTQEHIDNIRRDYTQDLKDREMLVRQRATAIYFIDRFALRNGNEKGDDEADTVGCCSLRFEHVTLSPPATVTFDFLGKDSIRYTNEVQVDPQVFKNLKLFKKDKQIGDLLFDRLQTTIVNKYLTAYMEGLTAKVFRTYNASWTFVQQLKDTPTDASIADKILAYNRANRMVAVLCNHQRSVSKGHSVAMEKMQDKIRGLKYQRKKLRAQLFGLLSAAEKKKKEFSEYNEDESDIDDDWIEQHEIDLVVLEREKITKKFEKENKKLEEGDEKPLGEDVLKERLVAADELEQKLADEKKGGWKATKFSSAEKVIDAIKKMDERIAAQKMVALDKDEGKEISLGTSKINYLDPRITFAWCKQHDVPVEKMLSKTLIQKFTWAAGAPADWEF